MKRRYATVDLTRVRRMPLSKRRSLSRAAQLAGIPTVAGARQFFDALPGFLKADDLRALIKNILAARRRGKPVVIMAGGHVVKVGLNPIIIDLIKQQLITGVCLNGAGLIHDYEMAVVGRTSEDVAAGLDDGSFGMARETAQWAAAVAADADAHGMGLGQAAGAALDRPTVTYRRHSLLAACHRYDIPAMIHLAVDTDIICQHPEYDPAVAARTSHRDFTTLALLISRAEGGGVFINIGSAVILPEVFLKALTVSRNIYGRPYRIITANFDMIAHYRPVTNVVHRPTVRGGKGYNFVGHHELMIPLLAWGLNAFSRQQSQSTHKPKTKRG